jgi:hypothetical protein
MNFQEAEKTYKDLKSQHAAGKLSDADFEAQVGKLKLQDSQGRWWQIGVQTGEWYMHDGQKWNKAKPPVEPMPVVTPAPPPPTESTIAPAVDANGNTAANNSGKSGRASVSPTRIFSPKPAGRGGLSTPVLIGIVAAVAIVGIAILVGGYYLLSGSFGTSQVRTTVTPTRVIASASPTLAVVVPTVRPTDVPTVAIPTVVISPTTPTTPTVAATVAPTRRPATAVAKPTTVPTKAGPVATATPNVPPGVYVMKLETDPPKIGIGGTDKITVGFKMTMFNNTGGVQTFKKWFVRIFQCPEQCTGDTAYRNSYGESLKQDVNVSAGTSIITTPQHASFGPGRCDYTAVPYFTGDNEIATQFMTTKGQPLFYNFSVCN